MVSAIIADGYLLKKKRDDKRSFLASKYQKRYFELTSDTLAYAKDPKELKDGGGDIEVFAIHELKYIKKLEDGKLEMKFPERVLRVKAESQKDHERWYEAIKDARQKKLDGNNTPQAKQLETLKEHTKQQILTAMEEDSDDDTPKPGTHLPPKKIEQSTKVETFLEPLSKQPQMHAPAPNNRPPSPRSLLANPRMGTMMIATPSRKNQMEEQPEEMEESPVPRHPKARSRWQDEEEEDAAAEAAAAANTSRPGTTASTASNGSSGKASQQPPSGRLMLGATEQAAPRSGGAGAPPAPRGEKLQLGSEGGRLPPPGPSAPAHHAPQLRASHDPGQKLSLGGPTTGPVSGAAGSRSSRPGSGHESGSIARGSTNSSRAGAGVSTAASTGPAPTEGTREEWEEDDWDSSDDDDDGKAAQQRQQQQVRQQRGPAANGRGTPNGGAFNVSARAAPEQPSPPPATQRTTPPRAQEPRKSNEHGGAAAAAVSAPAAPAGRGKAPVAAPAAKVREVEVVEEQGETALAKHAAGTDHLEDNWDSDEEEEEPAPAPKGRQQQMQPAPPQPQPQRRIPGPPPAAQASATRAPPAPRQAAAPGPPPAAAGPPGRNMHPYDEPAAPPSHGSAGSAAAAKQKLELGTREAEQPSRSNVVHNPAAKPDGNNWVDEDWDDDDD